MRVTQVVVQALRVVTIRPDTPTVSVSGETGYDALATTSAFSTSHPTATHAATQYQVQLYGGSWTSLVYDSGDSSDLLSHRVYNLAPFTQYQVRVRHKDSLGQYSLWSPATAFFTNDQTGTTPPFDATDWTAIWCVTDGFQVPNPGSWTWTSSSIRPEYENCWLQYKRYLQQSIMANNTTGGHYGARASGSFMWAGCECGALWGRYYDIELAKAGVAVCASGTFEVPQEATYYPIYQETDPSNFNWHGIIAYIQPRNMWPYGPCEDEGSPWGYLGAGRADFVVEVWYNGIRRYKETQLLPDWFEAKAVSCARYPFYSIALEVQRDFVTDPTGRTHVVKAAWKRGSVKPNLDDASQVDVEFTWVGGAAEDQGGDGGLPCGSAGFYGERYDQGPFLLGSDGGTGWTVHRNFSQSILQSGPCAAPTNGTVPENGCCEENPDGNPPTTQNPAPCPDDEPTTALELFMGTAAGQSVQFGRTQLDVLSTVQARLVTNHVAPEGFGADYLFTTCYFAFTHRGDVNVLFTPILNGERLDGEAVEMLLVGDGTFKTHEYKVALSEKYEDSGGTERIRHGLRGQYFAVQLEWIDICGYTQFDGVEVEYERLRESQPGVMIYTEEPFVWPRWAESNRAYFGDATGRMLLAGQTYQDGAADVGVVAKSNLVAPEGVGGECAFVGAYIQVTRSNETVLNLHVTPIVDGVEMGKQTLIYQPTTGDGGPVTEVEEIPITQFWQHGDAIERLRTNPRGTWFQVKVECDTLADGWIVIDGVELDYEAVRESESSIG